MADGRRAWLLVGLLLTVAGCGEGAPFEALPLRDALRAEPEAVAALPPAARQQLAERLEAARSADVGRDAVGEGAGAGALVAALDAARGHRDGRAFALVLGTYAAGRFAIELVRGDQDRGRALGLSTAQWVSLAVLSAMLATWMRRRARRRVAAATPPTSCIDQEKDNPIAFSWQKQ